MYGLIVVLLQSFSIGSVSCWSTGTMETPGADSTTRRLTSLHDVSLFGLDFVNLVASPHALCVNQLPAPAVDLFLLMWVGGVRPQPISEEVLDRADLAVAAHVAHTCESMSYQKRSHVRRARGFSGGAW